MAAHFTSRRRHSLVRRENGLLDGVMHRELRLTEALQVVEALTQGGPAEASEKLRTGDVLESIDGSPVAKMTDRASLPQHQRKLAVFFM